MTLLTLFHKGISSILNYSNVTTRFKLAIHKSTLGSTVWNVVFSRFNQGTTYDQVIVAHPHSQYYWPMDEAAGTVIHDIKSGTTGTYNNSPALGQAPLLQGDRGTSVYFNSAGTAYANTMVGASVPFRPTTQASLELWVKPTVTPLGGPGHSNSVIVSSTAVLNNLYFTWGSNSLGSETTVSFSTSPSGNIWPVYTGPYTLGNIYHIVVTFDGFVMRAYKNGVYFAQNAFVTEHLLGLFSDITLGKDPSTANAFGGYLAKVALYDVALDQSDIYAHYVLGSTPFNNVFTRFKLRVDGLFSNVSTRFNLRAASFSNVRCRFNLVAPSLPPTIQLRGQFTSGVNLVGSSVSVVPLTGESIATPPLTGDW